MRSRRRDGASRGWEHRSACGNLAWHARCTKPSVRALRTADGALWIEWATKLPLQNGERSKVIGAESIVYAKPLSALFGPDDLAAPGSSLTSSRPMGATW